MVFDWNALRTNILQYSANPTFLQANFWSKVHFLDKYHVGPHKDSKLTSLRPPYPPLLLLTSNGQWISSRLWLFSSDNLESLLYTDEGRCSQSTLLVRLTETDLRWTRCSVVEGGSSLGGQGVVPRVNSCSPWTRSIPSGWRRCFQSLPDARPTASPFIYPSTRGILRPAVHLTSCRSRLRLGWRRNSCSSSGLIPAASLS